MDSLKNKMFKITNSEVEIFCKIIHIFTVTLNQFNATLINLIKF